MKHRIARWGLLAAAAIALSGVACAQNVPAQFVVSGEATEEDSGFRHHQPGYSTAHCQNLRASGDRPWRRATLCRFPR